MIATPRIQRRYDHRLQALVKSTGSIEFALEHGIPRSTARGWLERLDSARDHLPPVRELELPTLFDFSKDKVVCRRNSTVSSNPITEQLSFSSTR
jgi:hypothetical protein